MATRKPERKTSAPKRPWTTARKAAISSYVRKIANQLKLSDWDIRLTYSDKPAADSGQFAAAHLCDNQRRCEVELCSDFLDMTREDQRDTVVHELLHCHLAVTSEAEDAVLGDVPVKLLRLSKAVLRTANELATDSLASAFAPLVPLPNVK